MAFSFSNVFKTIKNVLFGSIFNGRFYDRVFFVFFVSYAFLVFAPNVLMMLDLYHPHVGVAFIILRKFIVLPCFTAIAMNRFLFGTEAFPKVHRVVLFCASYAMWFLVVKFLPQQVFAFPFVSYLNSFPDKDGDAYLAVYRHSAYFYSTLVFIVSCILAAKFFFYLPASLHAKLSKSTLLESFKKTKGYFWLLFGLSVLLFALWQFYLAIDILLKKGIYYGLFRLSLPREGVALIFHAIHAILSTGLLLAFSLLLANITAVSYSRLVLGKHGE